jgi:general secretion pathway protein E
MGILAQRLVRLICPECRVPLSPAAARIELARNERTGLPAKEPVQLFVGQGCPACAHTGYWGRTGIYELLLVDETIRQLILNRAEAASIRQAAMSQGMQTMAEDGWKKVAQGLTTTQEVLRVTQE